MLIKVTKTEKTTVEHEVQTPSYFKKKNGMYAMICEDGKLVKFTDGFVGIYSPGELFYDSSVAEIISELDPCPEFEVKQAYKELVNSISESVFPIVEAEPA